MAKKKARTLDTVIDEMHKLREQRRALEEQDKVLKEQYDKLEGELIELADTQGIKGGKGSLASFSVVESVVPQVTNWDEFYKYIHREKYYHLLERRPSVTGCRELFETKGAIPGVDKFTKRKINLRSI